MRRRVNALFANVAFVSIAPATFQTALPLEAAAQDSAREDADELDAREVESRWVTSLAVTSGVWLQSQDGSFDSCLFADPADATGACPAPGSTPLRPSDSGNDLAIASFVGANFELMSPALPIPTRPRLFLSGEILPTFSADRDLAGEGAPGCIRGPKPEDEFLCARDEDPDNPRDSPYGEAEANGDGSRVTTTYDTLTFGANLGVAFPARVGERRLRIKPSFGWISYALDLDGIVVDANCAPTTQCTPVLGLPPGSLRETTLSGSDSARFHAIGPGLDIEMDTGRYGPLGTSVFLGGRAYWTFGDRTIEADTTQVYGDDGLPLANQAVAAHWEAELDPWIYRAGVGLRIQWLGSAK